MAAKKQSKPKKSATTTNQWDGVGPAIDQRLMKGLGHPLRIGILTILNDRVASPNELSKILEEGLSQISYHVKVLKDFDMIEMVKTEPRRGAVEHYYKATSEVFLSSQQLKLMPKSAQRKAFGGVLTELEDDMNTSLETGTFDKRPDWVVARDPRVLDDKGREDAEKAAAEFLEKYKEIGIEASKRLRNGEGEPVPTTAALLVSGRREARNRRRGRSPARAKRAVSIKLIRSYPEN